MSETANRSRSLDELIEEMRKQMHRENWESAQEYADKALRRKTYEAAEYEKHYVLACKANICLGRGRIRQALRYARKATDFAPNCPWSSWVHAEAAEAVALEYDDENAAYESIGICAKLRKRGARRVMQDKCSTLSLTQAKGQLNDCSFLMAYCYNLLGDTKSAIKYIKLYLSGRSAGLNSEYTITEAKGDLKRWQKET